ncbi:MAG: V-type ATP synthase subunit D [Clostridiales bacterium]|nr:V-type ATP synthase subunit D [Clostridiales bacterium]
MANTNVNPTRMELKRLKGRLATARRGHKLLKDKRDEIMRQFLDIVRENKELREKVEESLAKVHNGFSVAAAVSSPTILEQALMVPRREGEISVSNRNIMSVNVPEFAFQLKDGASAGLNYGYAFTSGELDAAVEALSDLLPTLVLLAQKEKTAQMLAEEIEKTRRRVNALEYIMIPDLEEGIKSISMKLDENERGNTTRLMKVKDLMLAKTLANARESHMHEA